MVRADLEQLTAIENETLSPWSASALLQELEIADAIRLVAETADGRIAGWCCGRVVVPEAELLKITVIKKSRRLGVAGLLLERLLDMLKARKVSSLFLEVRAGNQVALNFYRKNGFSTQGMRPGYYANPPDNALLLQKDLSSASG